MEVGVEGGEGVGRWEAEPPLLSRLLLFTSSPSHASFPVVKQRGSEKDGEFSPLTPPPARTA